MTPEHITSDEGNQLAVYDFAGEGPPTLLAHGAGSCATMLVPLASTLHPSMRSHALDMRGHGHSQRPPSLDYSWDAIARDVLATIRHLDLKKPVGIGHSFGATTMLLAEALRPGTFSWLYCYEPPLLLATEKQSDAGKERLDRARRRRSAFSSRQEAFEHFHDRGVLAECTDQALRAYVDDALTEVEDGTYRLVLDPDDEARIYDLACEEPLNELERVTCPVVVAFGDAGGPGPLFSRRVADHLSNVRLEPLNGPGHLGPMGMPDLVAASIVRSSEWATS